MNLEEIFTNYALNDGETLSFKIDFTKHTCNIKLKVRRHIKNQKFQPCEIELNFEGVKEIDISEDFRTNGGYSDITLTKIKDDYFYFSIDPFGNTGEPNERDNFVIIAKSLVVINE